MKICEYVIPVLTLICFFDVDFCLWHQPKHRHQSIATIVGDIVWSIRMSKGPCSKKVR